MRNLIDAHPNIACGPETVLFNGLLGYEKQNGQILRRLGVTHDAWIAKLRELFEWVHVPDAERFGKQRWADKTPQHGLWLEVLDEMYPACHVIHLVRNPRDVIESTRRRWGARRAQWAVRMWPRFIQAGREFGESQPTRYTEVRYEELVAHPDIVMRLVIERIGEPWDDAVLRFGERERARQDAELVVSGDERAMHLDATSDIYSSIGAGKVPANIPFILELRLLAGATLRDMGY